MKSGRLMRKIFAAVLSLSLVLASAVSVSALWVNNPGYSATVNDIQIFGLGGIYAVNSTVSFNAIVPGDPSTIKDFQVFSDGKELTMSNMDKAVQDANGEFTTNNFRISLTGSSADMKIVGENPVEVKVTYKDGSTKTAKKIMHTYATPGQNTAQTGEISSQSFENLPTGFNDSTLTEKAGYITSTTTSTSNATIAFSKFDNISVTGEKLIDGGNLLGSQSNNVLKFSTATTLTDWPSMTITPSKTTNSQILNFSFYKSTNSNFDILFNNDTKQRVLLSGCSNRRWHDVGIIYEQKDSKGAQNAMATVYIDGELFNQFAVSNTSITKGIIIRPMVGKDGYIAIDNLSLYSISGNVPRDWKLQYHVGDRTVRTDVTDGVISNVSNIAGLVINVTRGNGPTAKDSTSSVDADKYTVYKDGKDITDEVDCTFANSNPAFYYVVEYKTESDSESKKTFATGKYTVELASSLTLTHVKMGGKIRRDFYVTDDSGILLLPGTQTYDGETFNYNMEYGITSDKNLLVVAAIYGDNNKLEKVEIIPAPATGHEISGTLDGEGTKAALFVWDKESLKPIDDGVWEVAATTSAE